MQIPGGALGAASQQLAIDAQALDALKLQAKKDPEQALRTAAKQFEAVFLGMMLKSMRDASPKDGVFDSEATNMYTGMLDQQWVDLLSKKGIGVADVMVKQIQRSQSGHQPGNPNEPVQIKPLHPETTPLPIKPGARQPNLSTLEHISSSTQQGVQQMDDAQSPARHFVQRLWREAKQAESVTGVPAQFVLGQAALESGWGKHEIRHSDGSNSHNLFGIKAGSDWKGAVTENVTTEYVDGTARKVVEKFRAYGSYAEAFADYARLLTRNPHFAQTLTPGQSATQFAAQLQKSGYATDPEYAQKLTQVIEKTVRMVV
ncbi:MAG: flagellar assembly peptidoglycan hydrolase FlgJ [Burkholderiaceae bacterium]|nr:MAG: flagellar assembly peptidoglycan hydrolase FlgJ [Burkholderiaceae bacterium]